MARFFLHFRLNVYLCRIYPCRKPRKGKSRGGDIYIKGVTGRFGFDVLELRKLQNVVLEYIDIQFITDDYLFRETK